MHWYLSKIVFRIHCGEGQHTPQFDEQLRLIQAENVEAAFEKAKILGIAEEDSFMNNHQKLVKWEFIDVSELHKISALIDGAELYSRVTEQDNGYLYEEQVRRRASQIRSNIENNLMVTY